MIVKELVEILKKQDQDRLVVMSKDGEGNGFSPLADFGRYIYVADSTWSGEIYNPEEDEMDDDDRDVGSPALVLWPTN